MSGLKKGDALGWIRDFSKQDKDAIIVIENVTRIPEGDSALYDPRQYVENILVRSWKNNYIYIDDYHIDRRNLTVILTCPPEDEEQLRAICSMCSYAWVGDIEKKIENLMSEKKGIVLNRMYTGGYLSSNLDHGHEVINLFPDDDGDHYMYLNATGDFSAEHKGKIGSMLLIEYVGQDEDGTWVEVLGCATGLKDIYNPNQRKQSENDEVPSKVWDRKKTIGDIKYGGVPICDKGSVQQDVLISYYANELKIPQKGIRIFLHFAPFHGKASDPVVRFAYSDNFEAVPFKFKPNIDIPYLWKEKSTIGKSRLYSSELYVVKFASTSHKRFFIKDKGVSASEITKINNDLLKLASLISEEKLWRDIWRDF